DRSPTPYFIAAIIAAVAVWAVQQNWAQETRSSSRTAATEHHAAPSRSEDVRSVFSSDDYPAEAQRNNEQGTVQASLEISPEGRVSSCTIIRSSGHASLDNATCAILKHRAAFTPARDADGKAVASTYVTPPVVWRLED
ncbi:MAG TPA: energy transducer TonB, partial [Sphingomicrobium sp.]